MTGEKEIQNIRNDKKRLRFILFLFYIGILGGMGTVFTILDPEEAFRPEILINDIIITLSVLICFIIREGLPRTWISAKIRHLIYLFELSIILFLSLLPSYQTGFFFPYLVFYGYIYFGFKRSLALSLISSSISILATWTYREAMRLDFSEFGLSCIMYISFNLLFLLIAAYDVRDEKEKRKNKDLIIHLRTAHKKLEEYTDKAIELAASEERNRIAQEIHDSLGHYLTVVNIQLEKAVTFKERDDEIMLKAINDARWASHEALKDIRSSIETLRNEGEGFDFGNEIEKLVSLGSGKPLIEMDMRGEYGPYNRNILITLYRIVQEGLTNTRKHAEAGKVHLSCVFAKDEVRLSLCDDGRGFSEELLQRASGMEYDGGSYGLIGMEERVTLVGGHLSLGNGEDGGAELSVTIPKQPYAVN